jgi:hypothetical protein
LREIAALRAGLSALGDAAPSRDLWPAIAHARAREVRPSIVERLRRAWLVPVAAAAGAAAALAIVWSTRAPEAPAPEALSGQAAAAQAVAHAERTYREAIARLRGALDQRRPTWSPRVGATVQRSLAEIDRAIERCRDAVRQDPSNPEAQESLLAAYQQKVDLLNDLVQDSI